MADEPKKLSITLPPKDGTGPAETFTNLSSLVIVGPNGSGKSRLGYWIEKHQPEPTEVHRVAAQRALTFPPMIQPFPYAPAKANLLYGAVNASKANNRRWGSQPTTMFLNDFDRLLALLFADEVKRNREYVEKAKKTTGQPIPDCCIDVLLRIWNAILPQRRLILKDETVKAAVEDGTEYEGSEMSDGERVTLYLLGQCLCAPPNSVIVIDEPEIHLHRAIRAALWDHIESTRSDCLFVYITHDLEFASSRSTAKKIHVKEFDGSRWKWEEVPTIQELPEAVVLQIMGSRRSILFVEGKDESLDFAVFAALYPDRLVIPLGSCSRVVEATKILKNLTHLHHLDTRGIVDRDFRGDYEIEALAERGVQCIKLAEVENLLCTEEVIKIVAEEMSLEAGALIDKVKDYVISAFESEIESQIASRVATEVRYKLSRFEGKSRNRAEVESGFREFVDAIDITTMYNSHDHLLRGLLRERNYPEILKYYNRKSLPSRISSCFGLKEHEYPKFVLRKMNEGNAELRRSKVIAEGLGDKPDSARVAQTKIGAPARIIQALKAYVPRLDQDSASSGPVRGSE